MADTGKTVERIYYNFRGVDFRGDEVNLTRSPDSLNIWKNYKKTASIETRPGMALHTAFTEPVYAIYFYGGKMLVHSGNTLYSVAGGVKTSIYDKLEAVKSYGFVYDDIFYIIDGKQYLKYDGNTISEVEGYVPTTYISRTPYGGGERHQDVNMLTPRRINTFYADGISRDYYVDSRNLDETPLVVKVNDVVQDTSKYTVDYEAGKVTFVTTPSKPLTDGQDNVSIEFSKTISTYRQAILNCTMLQVFDNRVFLTGNPSRPNYVWHCSLNDPSYFSDLDYYQEGMDEARITGIAAGNNSLWVFRAPSEANTNVFYHVPSLDETYGKIYPSSHSSISLGCVGKATNFSDDIVFFSDRGMEGVNGDINSEQMAAHRSTTIDRKLLGEDGYSSMILQEHEGYLFVIIGNKIYLADSRATYPNGNHNEYEWFYWEMEKDITAAALDDGILYFGTNDGIYTLTDNECDIESWWVTPKDKFETPHKLKTTNKKGCVVEALGDVSVYVKTNRDTDFELVGDYTDITDYFASRIKKKKWKDIQLKFYSSTRFSLESATLESVIGGYIKR
jgi:hypothetical protein